MTKNIKKVFDKMAKIFVNPEFIGISGGIGVFDRYSKPKNFCKKFAEICNDEKVPFFLRKELKEKIINFLSESSFNIMNSKRDELISSLEKKLKEDEKIIFKGTFRVPLIVSKNHELLAHEFNR